MKRITVSMLSILLMLSLVFSSSVFAADKVSAWDSFKGLFVKAEATEVGVEYRGHIQNKGDFPTDVDEWVQGPERLGTVGESLRLEGFWIQLTGDAPDDLNIEYEVHVQNVGWMDPVQNGEFAGTEGASQRIESIMINLVDDEGMPSEDYSVYYTGHVQNQGDVPANDPNARLGQTYYADGEKLGTEGQSLRLEALEVWIVKNFEESDLTAYNALLADFLALDEADYTAESYEALDEIITNNVVTVVDPQEEVDAAVEAIQAGFDGLVEVLKVESVSAINAAGELEGTTVDRNVNIQITFTEPIAKESLTVANFKVKKGQTLAALRTPTVSFDGKTVTLRPTNVLEASSDYTLTISKDIISGSDATVTLGTDKMVSFKTNDQVVVTKVNLQNAGGANVANGGNIAEGSSVTATNVNKVAIEYNENLSLVSVSKDNVKLFCVTDNEYVPAENVTYAAKVITFEVGAAYNNTTANLIQGKEYRIETKNIEALDGSAAADYARTFKIADTFINASFPALADGRTLPQVSSPGDVNGTLDNIYDSKGKLTDPAFKIYVRFGNDVEESTLTDENIKIVEVETQKAVPGTLSYNSSNKTLSVVPNENLKDSTNYTLFISKEVKDVYGLSLPNNKTYAFRTGDFLAPSVESTTPEVGSASVALDTKIAIKFNEEMDPATFKNNNNAGSITGGTGTTETEFGSTTSVLLLDRTAATLTSIAATMTWSESNTKLTITPNADLKLNNSYEVKLLGKHASLDAVTDKNGTDMLNDYSLSFNTTEGSFEGPKVAGIYKDSVTGTELTSGVKNISNTGKVVFKMDKTLDLATVTTDTFTAAYTVGVAGTVRLFDVTNDQYINLGDTAPDVFTVTNFADLEYATIAIDFNNIAQRDGANALTDLVVDTDYRLILTTGIEDNSGNSNAMQFDTYFNFTTGPAPFVDEASSYPAAFDTDIPVDAEYIPVVVTDADSILTKSTLNDTNIQLVKKADGTAAPYTLKADYTNELNDVAEASAVRGTPAITDENLPITDAAKAKLKEGSIIVLDETTDGLVGTYVVTGFTGSAGTWVAVLDRTVTNNFDKAGNITVKSGVVFKRQAGIELDGNTEYQVKTTGITDKVGNPITDKTYTFRTAKKATDLEYVSGTVENGVTGVPVNQALEFKFNTPLASATTGVAITENGTDVKAKFDLELKSGDDTTVVATPKGFLVANKAYAVTFDNSTFKNTTAYGAKTLDDAKTVSFQTEATASVEPKMVSAVYFDLGTVDVVDTGDVVKLTFNTELAATAAANGDADFTLAGIGSDTFDIDNAGTAVVDEKTVIITLGTAPKLAPGVSTVKVTGATWKDGMGNNVKEEAVTIVRY